MGNRLPHKSKLFIAKIIDNEPNLSVINKIELLSFSEIKPLLNNFIEQSNILPLHDEIANKTILIRRQNKIKLPDAIIAATALIHNLILVTRNTVDFKNIPELQLINPWE